MKKQCSKCKETKLVKHFHNNKSTKDGKSGYCKECRKIVTPEQRERDNRKRREEQRPRKYVLKKFNMTIEDYETLLIEQNGCCAICNRHHSEFTRRMPLDHDHTTNAVRGILCDTCNLGLGIFNDDINQLKKLLTYLKQHD